MTFEEWIDEIGVVELAQRLKINRVTVRNWRVGQNDPRVDHIRRMVRMSRGVLTYEKIIDRKILLSKVPTKLAPVYTR